MIVYEEALVGEIKGYPWKITKIFYYILILSILAFIFKKTFGLLMPFVIGIIVSFIVCNIAKKISTKVKIPERVLAVLILIAFLIAVGFIAYMLIERLVSETGRLVDFISSGAEDKYINKIVQRLEELFSENNIFEKADGAVMISELADKLINGLSTYFTTFLGKILKTTPRFIVSTVVTIMSCFYFTADRERIMKGINDFFYRSFGNSYIKGKKRVKKVALNYLRAYGKLFILTFVEVFVGLLIIKTPYALIMAICIAAVDILPIFGAGTILLPWSAAVFLWGDHRMSLALVMLYGVITIVRQIAEPRILGNGLGIHPLLSIFCVSVGFGLYGGIGILIGPIFASVVAESLKEQSSNCI